MIRFGRRSRRRSPTQRMASQSQPPGLASFAMSGPISPASAAADPVGTMARLTRQEFATKTQTFDPFVDEILQFVNAPGAPTAAATRAGGLARDAVLGTEGVERRDAARYGLDFAPVEARRTRDFQLDATLADAAASNAAMFATRDLQDSLGVEMLGLGRGVQTNAFGALGAAAAGAQDSEANRVAAASARRSAAQARTQGALSSAMSLGGAGFALGAAGKLGALGVTTGLGGAMLGGGAGLLLGLI